MKTITSPKKMPRFARVVRKAQPKRWSTFAKPTARATVLGVVSRAS